MSRSDEASGLAVGSSLMKLDMRIAIIAASAAIAGSAVGGFATYLSASKAATSDQERAQAETNQPVRGSARALVSEMSLQISWIDAASVDRTWDSWGHTFEIHLADSSLERVFGALRPYQSAYVLGALEMSQALERMAAMAGPRSRIIDFEPLDQVRSALNQAIGALREAADLEDVHFNSGEPSGRTGLE